MSMAVPAPCLEDNDGYTTVSNAATIVFEALMESAGFP